MPQPTRSFRTLFLFAALTFASALTGRALPLEPPPPAAVPSGDPRIAKASERLLAFQAERRIPGLSVAVGYCGQLVWAEAFGLADLEAKSPMTVDTVLPLGSTSKVLTSLALGQLVEAGALDLDAPIETYVPYFPKKDHPITARQLAGHLAGLRDYDVARGEYANTRSFRSIEEAVGVFRDDPLQFVPGTKYSYSAYNFVLLSAAIEGASGRDFLSFVDQRITEPLGLSRTKPNRQPLEMPGLATAYVSGFFGIPTRAGAIDVSNKWAAGGFVSTPSEMVRLGNAVLAGQVVSPKTFELLTTPQKLADGSDTGAGYGLGWRSGKKSLPRLGREVRVVHHGGVANGAMSFFVLIPELDLVVSLQGNLTFDPFVDFAEAAYAVADLFAR